MPAQGEPERFKPDASGFPPLHLIDYRDSGGIRNLRLCEDSTGLLVGPTDRRLFRVGVYSYNLRGEHYATAACRKGDFRPGTPVRLVRQPDNKHDPFAVAITADDDAAKPAGYLSRGHAKRLAKLLDQGLVLRAVSTRGTGPGDTTDAIAVVAAAPELMEHLLSRRPSHLPRPAHLRH